MSYFVEINIVEDTIEYSTVPYIYIKVVLGRLYNMYTLPLDKEITHWSQMKTV
jgi:hypothetical protein